MVLGSCNVGDCGKCNQHTAVHALTELEHWSVRPGCGDPLMLSKCRFWDLQLGEPCSVTNKYSRIYIYCDIYTSYRTVDALYSSIRG